MLWTFCKLLLRRTICNLVARNTRIVMFSFYLLREFKKMAALIGRMWRSAFTHVLRDVSNVSPRIQPSNSLKSLFTLIIYLVTWKKNLTEKCIHFFFTSIRISSKVIINWSNEPYCSTVYRKLLEVSILSVIFFSSGGHPCTRWIFGKNANSLQTGRSLSSSPHSLSANKPTTDIDTTTESSDEVQTQ